MQLFGSLGGYYITFRTSGRLNRKRPVVWGASLYFSLLNFKIRSLSFPLISNRSLYPLSVQLMNNMSRGPRSTNHLPSGTITLNYKYTLKNVLFLTLFFFKIYIYIYLDIFVPCDEYIVN
jgi:hypothetical protein